MSRITLKQFSVEKGQTRAAALLGMSQGALNKALRVRRDIFVTDVGNGSFVAEEVRPFPSQRTVPDLLLG
ncbi:Cro/Cl family transcriptional regulator [Pseudomonas simiae]|uniref:Cro/CI family transcriptional regulator n=1 Tax=Pseudomonas simiae TaxID=321846 RepID=UPI0005D77346|nr:Cro/CI family transcriptional regulator [Pseudomonas simiae]AJZ95411.1 Cro/Cl family transcriptional regulator [Pseudomonas simiae]